MPRILRETGCGLQLLARNGTQNVIRLDVWPTRDIVQLHALDELAGANEIEPARHFAGQLTGTLVENEIDAEICGRYGHRRRLTRFGRALPHGVDVGHGFGGLAVAEQRLGRNEICLGEAGHHEVTRAKRVVHGETRGIEELVQRRERRVPVLTPSDDRVWLPSP